MVENIHEVLADYRQITKNVTNMVQEIMDDPKVPLPIKVDILLESDLGKEKDIPLCYEFLVEDYIEDRLLYRLEDMMCDIGELEQSEDDDDKKILEGLYDLVERMVKNMTIYRL